MSTDGEAMEKMNIITVSTGTKCVNGEHMSDCGNALNGKKITFYYICYFIGLLKTLMMK